MRMQSSKFVIKCGNFAVLVDLHVLPLGSQDNASWFSAEHRKEVGSLIRDSVEQKVRQFQEARYQKIQPKPRKDLTLNTPLCLEGENVRVEVYFMKRHINLRCIVRQHYRELRVFPERVVVCASPPENAVLPNGNLNQDATQQSGQSKSKYFSSPDETKDPLPSSTATKRAVLQKIARQANTQARQRRDEQVSAQPQVDTVTGEGNCPALVSSECLFGAEDIKAASLPELTKNDKEVSEGAKSFQNTKNHLKQVCPDTKPCPTSVKRKQQTPNYTENQKAKRLRLGEVTISSDSNKPSSDIPTQAFSRSSHGVAQPEIRLEEEVLTDGNSTAAQTNQSRLAARLRGQSAKPVSSGSSISSRSAAREERRGSAPRTSRLRRLKKS
ncbi:protein SLX4IP isoform X2 [Paramisgurnus dabryanus]|uniref:protein SLX4IP isoform X2 n=1 Tax=Paramisgurnus dabryanus TaxID=90735 RepID=UPI0031F3E495